jgi:hypothetical protein
MRHSIAIAAVAAILGFVPLGSLNAQPVTYYPDANWDLPPDGVLAIVRSNGLEPRSQPQRQGAAYALRALGPTHKEVEVTVDARSGRILRIEGADDRADNPHAGGAPRPNVAPATKLIADASGGSLTAQPVTYYPDANWDLPPDGVLAIVRSNGLEPRSQPQRQGAAYALRALDPTHQEVQVTVDARSGRILRIEGADDRADNPHAVGAPRPNVAPATKPVADASGSKSGGAEAARPRPKVVAQTSVPSPLPKNVEVLGNRVRCDVRYQELKLPESEYRVFFNRCMGTPAKAGLKDVSNATEHAVKAKEEPMMSPALQNAMKELSNATEHAVKAKEEPMMSPALQNAMKELSNATEHALKMQQVTSDARAL